MTMQNLEAGVFGEVHPVTVDGKVAIEHSVYNRPEAAEYGSWATFSFLGNETGPVRLMPRDQYRSRAMLYVNAPPGTSVDPAPVQANSPGANTVLASAVLPAGTYSVNWLVTLAGTLAAADRNNVGIFLGPTLLYTSDNNINVGTVYGQNPVTITVPAGGGTLSLQTIGAGTAASIYDASFTATPLSAVWVGTLGQLSRPGVPQGGKLFSGTYEIKNQLDLYAVPDGVNPATITVLLERYDAYPDEPIITEAEID